MLLFDEEIKIEYFPCTSLRTSLETQQGHAFHIGGKYVATEAGILIRPKQRFLIVWWAAPSTWQFTHSFRKLTGRENTKTDVYMYIITHKTATWIHAGGKITPRADRLRLSPTH
jgi:hypothetical protein